MTNDRDMVQQPNDPGAGREETSRAGDGLVATAFGLTDIGSVRSTNQDTLGNRVGRYAAQTASLGLLYAIADGMGGHARGEVASALSIEQLFARYYHVDPHEAAPQALARVMVETNAAVFQAGRDHGGASMGTTLTLALLRDNTLYVGNIGDSRTYRIRDGQIEQLTHDHSLIGEQVRGGLLTEDQARQSSIRNVITRAVGYREQVEPDIFTFPVAPNDILLLCSDGLHGLADRQELAQAFNGQPLGTAVSSLIELAKQRGGSDNITALAVRVDQSGTASAALADAATLPFTRSLNDAVTKPFARTDEATEPINQPVAVAVPGQASPAPQRPPAPPAAPPPGAPPPSPSAAPIPPPPRAQPASRLPIALLIAVPLLLLTVIGAGVVFLRGRAALATPTATVVGVASAPIATPTSAQANPSPSAAAAIAATLPATTIATARAVPSNGPTIPTPAPPGTTIPGLPATVNTPTAGPSIALPSVTLVSGTIRFTKLSPPIAQKVPDEWEVVVYAASLFPQGLPARLTPEQFANVVPTWSGTIQANGIAAFSYEVRGPWALPGDQAATVIVLRNRANPARILIPEPAEQSRITANKNQPVANHLLTIIEPVE